MEECNTTIVGGSDNEFNIGSDICHNFTPPIAKITRNVFNGKWSDFIFLFSQWLMNLLLAILINSIILAIILCNFFYTWKVFTKFRKFSMKMFSFPYIIAIIRKLKLFSTRKNFCDLRQRRQRWCILHFQIRLSQLWLSDSKDCKKCLQWKEVRF